jgi:DNA topoisomerase-1
MPKTLVVVESPAKAKTIEKYLGGDYTVRASYGHIRDLPKSQLGVDVEHDFEPAYMVPEESERHVRELKSAHKKADELVLATDYDREGEAIAFHVATILGVSPDVAKRVTFTEITKDAILEAFREPREIDMKLVDAQQARRVLDRLVGYRISPLLWKRVRPGLSAGRVQSVAVRLIVEREREIQAFNPVEYWSVDVRLTPDGDPQPFLARLVEVPEGKLAASPDKKGVHLGTEADAAQHVERLNRSRYRVMNVERKERKRSPAPPFTTSTLQQEAARKLGFSARKTMTLAQRLYEGIDLPGEGTVGLITYMRTDSLNIADSALREIAELVKTEYGQAYSLDEPRRYKTRSRSAQEAHEAVRPTSVLRTPELMRRVIDPDQLRMYRLIWQRTVATQVADARFNQVGIDIHAAAQDGAAGEVRYGLRATGQTLVFDGFIRIYKEGRDDQADPDAESTLPELTLDQVLRMLEVLPEQHFTQPPPRYSEASLVKTLEELGIGRPSTYASIISTIQDRGYVRLEEKRFYPEDVGMVVTDKLIEHFPDVVDVNFTAHMEDELDDIAEGGIGWTQVLHEFNEPFERALEKAEHSFERYEEELDELCPLCPKEGREPGKLQVKLGRFGKFIGCPNYPECRYIRNMDGSERPEPVLLDETCPECGVHKLQERVGRYGPFVGCSGYPECRYIRKDPPVTTGVTCPECKQGEVVERKNRFGAPFYSCDRYPECTFAVSNPPIKDHPCPECGSLLLQRPKSVKCWNCGAELDLDFHVTKEGDPETEAAVRAAKAASREARAKAKKKPAAQKTAGKKTGAKRKGAAKKKQAAKRVSAAAAGAAALATVPDAPEA